MLTGVSQMPSDEPGGESAATTPAEGAADTVYRVTDPTFLLRDRGYTEWYTQRLSKYRERVVYRRWNRWQIVYYLAPLYGGFPSVADSLPYVELPTYWLNETLGSAPLGLHWFHAVALAALAGGLLGSVYCRLDTQTEERLRGEAYYPPKAYWEAVRDERGDSDV